MAQPKYLQVIELLKTQYAGCEANTPIQSEREIAASLNFSRMTVRKAVEELCRQGFLYRDGNKGTFLSGRMPESVAIPEHRRILFLDTIYDSNNVKNVQSALRLSDHARLFRLIRLVQSEDIPLRIEEIYSAEENISDEEIGRLDSFLDLDGFRKAGSATSVLKPAIIPGKYNKLMQLRAEQPVICKEELIRKKDGTPFLFINTIYNPETSPLNNEDQ